MKDIWCRKRLIRWQRFWWFLVNKCGCPAGECCRWAETARRRSGMIRARFTVKAGDYRPVVWPIKHPYWCSGYHGDGSGAVLVAYADNIEQIKKQWPEAEHIDVMEETDHYTFTDRFKRPDWLKP